MRFVLVTSFVALTLGTVALAHDEAVPLDFPSSAHATGWANPEVKPSTTQQTICVKGWTATIRPPYSYTSYLKSAQIRYYKLPGTTSDYEEDHLIPLELGGSPFDTRNLWPEAYAGANNSDPLENSLRSKVCAGTLTLKEARQQIIAFKRANG